MGHDISYLPYIKVTGIDHITCYYPNNSGCKIRLSSGTSIRVTQTEAKIDELIEKVRR